MPKFANAINLQQNELQNARLQNVAGYPSTPVEGQVFWNSTGGVKHVYVFSGTQWIQVDGVSSEVSIAISDALVPLGDRIDELTSTLGGDVDGLYSYIDSEITSTTYGMHHLTHSDVTDFDAQVRTSRLDQMAMPTAAVSLNSQRIASLGAPIYASDAATRQYVDDLATGLKAKDACAVATTANIDRDATPGTLTIDGYACFTGDRILLKNQIDAVENGVYVWDEVTGFTRATYSWIDYVAAYFFIANGATQGSSGWLCTIPTGTDYGVDSDPLTFVQFTGLGQITAGSGLTKTGNVLNVIGSNSVTVNADSLDVRLYGFGGLAISSSGLGLKLADGSLYMDSDGVKVAVPFYKNYADNPSTANPWVFTHGMGNKDMCVTLREVATGSVVFADIVIGDTNVTITFAVAPTVGQYHLTVMGS